MNSNSKKTKILVTVGPQTSSVESIKQLIAAGVNAVRLNMSHGNYDFFSSLFENIHTARTDFNSPLAILADIQGPKIRIGELKEPQIEIFPGNEIEITTDDIIGNEKIISTSYKNLQSDAEVGDLILINDGLIRLKISKKKEKSIVCEIENGGILSPRKGMNLPGMKLSTPSLTEKDFEDLNFLIDKPVDYIALSFVRKTDDILQLKEWLIKKRKSTPVIAKIEKKEAIDSFDSILNAADGIMVARGDLGVELSPAKVPVIQKEIIKRCNETGKLVITATQMLESLINSPIPTRAEAADVANAVWDGTDVVMLSGETSVGKYPVETVKMMHEIIINAEQHFIMNENIKFQVPEAFEENLFDSVLNGITSVAEQIKANAIVVFTYKGRAARGLAKFRPSAKIIAISDSFETMNNLCLDALVNNAGILERQMRVDEMDAGRIERVLRVNVLGSFLCAREAVRRMSRRHGGGGGAIVNVSSMAARLGSPHEYVDYAASKGAIDALTVGLAREVAAEGIRVNAVRPGVIYTDIHASGGEPGRVDRVKGSVPMQRGGTAAEVAEAIVWLLSDEASYSTGAFVDVSGGR